MPSRRGCPGVKYSSSIHPWVLIQRPIATLGRSKPYESFVIEPFKSRQKMLELQSATIAQFESFIILSQMRSLDCDIKMNDMVANKLKKLK
jgi:hypothetical protein